MFVKDLKMLIEYGGVMGYDMDGFQKCLNNVMSNISEIKDYHWISYPLILEVWKKQEKLMD